MFSVIVPAYNCADYLSECINSIRAQCSDNWEIILVNDGSTDDTGLICDEFASSDKRISVIHQNNCGQNGARLRGLSEAKGDYVTFVDSDDVVSEKMIEVFQQTIESHTVVDLAIYGIVKSDEYLQNQSPIEQNLELNGCYQTMQFRQYVFSRILLNDSYSGFGIAPSLCGKLYRRELALKCMSQVPKSVRMGEDGAVFHTAAWLSRMTVVSLNYNIYCYRINRKSISHRYIPNMIHHNALLYDYYVDTLSDSNDINVLTRLNQYYLYMTNLALMQEVEQGAFRQTSYDLIHNIINSDSFQTAIDNLPRTVNSRWFSIFAFLSKRKLLRVLMLIALCKSRLQKEKNNSVKSKRRQIPT